MTTKQEALQLIDLKLAQKLIDLKLAQIDVLVAEAKELAEKHNVTFDLEPGGHGMGGTYIPRGQREEWGIDPEDEDHDGWHVDGWYGSSQNC